MKYNYENKIRIVHGITDLILKTFFMISCFLYGKDKWLWLEIIVFVVWIINCYTYGMRWVIKSHQIAQLHLDKKYDHEIKKAKEKHCRRVKKENDSTGI